MDLDEFMSETLRQILSGITGGSGNRPWQKCECCLPRGSWEQFGDASRVWRIWQGGFRRGGDSGDDFIAIASSQGQFLISWQDVSAIQGSNAIEAMEAATPGEFEEIGREGVLR
ncbi:hypothetical protein [Mesorhizobium sp. 43Arga]